MTRLLLGRTLSTPGALRAIEEAGLTPAFLLDKHATGDWGDVDSADWAANQRALIDGSRVLSAYQIGPDVRVWITTEAQGDDGLRESTTILLPSEY